MEHITLNQALETAAQGAYSEAHKRGPEWFAAWKQALEHHTRRKLRANIKTGTVRDVDGIRAQFTAYDWQDTYTEAPHFIFWDFFAPDLNNSADRILRNLKP